MQILTPDQQTRAAQPGLQTEEGTRWNMNIYMEIPAPVQLLCDLEKYIGPIGDFPNKYLSIY